MAHQEGALSSGVSWGIALLLAIAHWVVAVLASQHNAVTFDEVAHVAGGMAQVLLGRKSALCHPAHPTTLRHLHVTSRQLAHSGILGVNPPEATGEIAGKT